MPLTALECERLRKLGAIAAHAVEATARNFEPGETEADIAGHLANRLIKHEVHPHEPYAAPVADGRDCPIATGISAIIAQTVVFYFGNREPLGPVRGVTTNRPPSAVRRRTWVMAFSTGGDIAGHGMFSRNSAGHCRQLQKVRESRSSKESGQNGRRQTRPTWSDMLPAKFTFPAVRIPHFCANGCSLDRA